MAMQRRALAYHIAGICTFQTIDGLIQRMFALMTKEPVRGFRAVSLQQVINADREMWMLAAQEARGKVLTDPAKPLDGILETAFKAPETSYHLLPLPSVSREPSAVGGNAGPTKRPFKGGNNYPSKKGKSKGKGIDLPTGLCVRDRSWSKNLFPVQPEEMQPPRQGSLSPWPSRVLGKELRRQACSC